MHLKKTAHGLVEEDGFLFPFVEDDDKRIEAGAFYIIHFIRHGV